MAANEDVLEVEASAEDQGLFDGFVISLLLLIMTTVFFVGLRIKVTVYLTFPAWMTQRRLALYRSPSEKAVDLKVCM